VRLGSDGSCEALTMLRFARVAGGWAEVRTGGSLLADSDPEREEAETRLKAESVFRVLASQSPRPPVAAEAAPPVRALRFIDHGDALAALARESLLQAGARLQDAAAITVLGDAPLARLRDITLAPGGPTLALNNAALRLLEQEGAALQPLPVPQFGRALASQAAPGGLLAALGRFDAGLHATHRLDAAGLPPGWTLLARGEDGRVVAACHAARRIVALAFRPDALRSLRHGAGRRALVAALQWLHEAAA
jgi:anthranilate synthase